MTWNPPFLIPTIRASFRLASTLSQEDAELLRLVREWHPPAALHPIAMQAWQIYEDGGLTLSGESMEKIKDALEGYNRDLKALGEALEGLVRFSILLSDHQHDPISAEKVVGLMRLYTPLFEPFWIRVTEALANVGTAAPSPSNSLSETRPPGDGSRHEPLR